MDFRVGGSERARYRFKEGTPFPGTALTNDGSYQDIVEFVESIPYTETREYVQAILRNREIYRALYATP